MHLKNGNNGEVKMLNKKGSVSEIMAWGIILVILFLVLQQIGWIK